MAALRQYEALDTADPVRLGAELRRDLAPALAAAVAEQLTFRARARARGLSPAFLWTPETIEMVTHPLVAGRRALRLAECGGSVADLTCGAGGDLAAVASQGFRAIGLDRDPVAALIAAANVPGAAVVAGDARRPPFELSGLAVIIDPSRRRDSARRFDPAAFSPPWDVALDLARAAAAGVVKGPPGLPLTAAPPDFELEFVQLGRTLREAALWRGPATQPGLRRAVHLPSGEEITSLEPECTADSVAPGAVILDPESCVTRAGLVRQLGARHDARLLDPQVAYLTCDEPADTVLASSFRVLDCLPFSVGRLKSHLRERRWKPVEIRRRAFPIEPDELRRLLGPIEGAPVALLCTTIGGRRTVLCCEPGTKPTSQ